MKKVLLLALIGSLAACGGDNKTFNLDDFDITNPIDSTVDLVIDGIFTGAENIEIEFDGDKAFVRDFGDSILGTNPKFLSIGDTFINDIRCDKSVCSGLVAVPELSNGLLKNIKWETVTISQEKNKTVKLVSTSLGEQNFNPKVENVNPPITTLEFDADCKEWWNALTKAGTWRATWVGSNSGIVWGKSIYNNDPGDLTFKFSGENNFHFKWITPQDSKYYDDISGEAVINYNMTSMGHCRIIAGYPVLYPHSLVDGELTLIQETGSSENNYTGSYEVIMKLKAE